MKSMRMIGADHTDFGINAMSMIDTSLKDHNEIKIIRSNTEQRSMAPIVNGYHRPTVNDGMYRRRKSVFWKIRFHHNNIVFLLVPLLLMILKETSALPPIIKIGEWQIFPNSFHTHTHKHSLHILCIFTIHSHDHNTICNESITHISLLCIQKQNAIQ